MTLDIGSDIAYEYNSPHTVRGCLVDYIGFTLPSVITGKDLNPFSDADCCMLLQENTGDLFNFQGVFEKEPFGMHPSSRAYKVMWRSDGWGFSMFAGGQSHVLYEFSGHGCQWLRDHDRLEALLKAVQGRLTRIDVAVDIDGRPAPQSVVRAIENKRYKSSGSYNSATGDTEYIGSRTSDSFLKVYRYNHPHPRHETTRIEFTMRKKWAEALTNNIVYYGVGYAAQQLIDRYKIKGIGMIEENVTKLTAPSETRKKSSTLMWLIKQCAPAFKKLCEQGEIADPEEFLKQHFLDGIKEFRQLSLEDEDEAEIL